VGGDELQPLGIDLGSEGPGFVVAGPPRAGRSSALVTMARSLLARGTPVVLVTPRRSPLRDLAGTEGVVALLDDGGRPELLREAVGGRERYVVVVDDAELLYDTALDAELSEVVRSGRDGGHGLVAAGTTDDLGAQYRGFLVDARRSRSGLLLAPRGAGEGDLLAVRLPRNLDAGPVGRGLLVVGGTARPVQVALS
jgi:S-DNA-T family DNA segregation ATPase FtsK/SpoIIIE